MALRLYNTLTRTIEPFTPLHPPRVAIYACGPTVWNVAHIGNFRTFLFTDLLRRYLAHTGHDVFMVMNLTDVDDRIIAAAGEARETVAAFTARFASLFFEDRDFLRIIPAHVYPRATEYIEPMVALVTRLLRAGLAYRGEDGSVYFAVRQFASYGRLSRLDTRELKTGARVTRDEYTKEDAQDFALWKAASAADEAVGAAWDAPFGRGRPGWHLECSAMALTELRSRFGVETLDIHAGAVDLIFPHHENEIAQSEGVTGQPFARVWMHGEFLTMSGTKMSKRFGNILTARDLKEGGADPGAIRMLVYSTHYRQPLNFTDEALAAATEGVARLAEFRDRLRETTGATEAAGAPESARALEREFHAALDDDLNAPRALGAVFNMVRAGNRELDSGGWSPGAAAGVLAAFDRVMGVLDVLPAQAALVEETARWIEERIEARRAARAAGDYAAADAIRDEVATHGFELEDTPQGTRWKRGPGQGSGNFL
ncbi:MAG TPA: cysteine--tRNA ligase [Gemmatimonadales bacterium]